MIALSGICDILMITMAKKLYTKVILTRWTTQGHREILRRARKAGISVNALLHVALGLDPPTLGRRPGKSKG